MRQKTPPKATLFDSLQDAVDEMWRRYAETGRKQFCIQFGNKVAVSCGQMQTYGRVMCRTISKGCVR